MDTLRILVVDDSTLYRKVIRDSLNELPNVQVVGVANNGRDALERIRQHKPDLVTLDVEMPQLNGLEVLEHLSDMDHDSGVIMLSSLTSRGAIATTKALQLGAFDFVLKPEGKTLDESVATLKTSLLPRVKAFADSRRRSVPHPKRSAPAAPPAPLFGNSGAARGGKEGLFAKPAETESNSLCFSPTIPPNPNIRPEVVAIGVSTGGPAALMEVIPRLPAGLKVPIFIVQHMPPVFTRSLAEALDAKSRVSVVEAENGMRVSPGSVYIAPGGHQMKIKKDGVFAEIEINDDPPENSSRPSVDYMFRSVAKAYGSRILGVIMTGMGSDGAIGCRDIKRNGGSVITQSEASCVVYGMPRATYEAGLSDAVCELSNISGRIVDTLNGVARTCI